MKILLALTALLFSSHLHTATLYTDDWVRGMARMNIDETRVAHDLGQPILDVVPAGETRKIADIFKKLNIDREKIIAKGEAQIMHVRFYQWQISNSFLLSIMVGIKDSANNKRQKQDLFAGDRRL